MSKGFGEEINCEEKKEGVKKKKDLRSFIVFNREEERIENGTSEKDCIKNNRGVSASYCAKPQIGLS